EVVGAELGRLHRGLDGSVAGDHHHGGLGTDSLELREGVESIRAGHPDVEEDQVRALVLQPRNGFLRRSSHGDPVPLVLQHAAQGLLDRPLVVDDEDVLRGHQAETRSAVAADTRSPGSSITNRLPWGALSSTQMVPPWSATIWWTMESPRPI